MAKKEKEKIRQLKEGVGYGMKYTKKMKVVAVKPKSKTNRGGSRRIGDIEK